MLQITPQMKVLVAVDATETSRRYRWPGCTLQGPSATRPFTGTVFIFAIGGRRPSKCWCMTARASGFVRSVSLSGRFRWWPARTSHPADSATATLAAHQLAVLFSAGNPSRTGTAPDWRPLVPAPETTLQTALASLPGPVVHCSSDGPYPRRRMSVLVMTRSMPEIIEVTPSSWRNCSRQSSMRSARKMSSSSVRSWTPTCTSSRLSGTKTRPSPNCVSCSSASKRKRRSASRSTAEAEASPGSGDPDAEPGEAADTPIPRNHGRRGADEYAGAQQVDIPHPTLCR